MGLKSRGKPVLLEWAKTAEAALIESIEHWRRMASGTHAKDEYPSGAQCACCEVYYDNGCGPCPIAKRTEEPYCRGTPYYRAHSAFCSRRDGRPYSQAELDAEVEYLEETLMMVRRGELD